MYTLLEKSKIKKKSEIVEINVNRILERLLRYIAITLHRRSSTQWRDDLSR